MTSPNPISPLPNFRRYITTHNSQGKAVVLADETAHWTPWEDRTLGFSTVYTSSEFPPNLNGDADLARHEAITGPGSTLGLVNPGGTVCRVVDFSPSLAGIMHRTQSLDYGIVLEGEIELVLDSGEKRLLSKGDMTVQRATMHTWRNPSSVHWARMLFVLQHAQPVVVDDAILGEDLGECKEIQPSERNHVSLDQPQLNS